MSAARADATQSAPEEVPAAGVAMRAAADAQQLRELEDKARPALAYAANTGLGVGLGVCASEGAPAAGGRLCEGLPARESCVSSRTRRTRLSDILMWCLGIGSLKFLERHAVCFIMHALGLGFCEERSAVEEALAAGVAIRAAAKASWACVGFHVLCIHPPLFCSNPVQGTKLRAGMQAPKHRA